MDERRNLRARSAAGETLIGSFVTIGNGVVGEVMGHAGFDFLIVDIEHTGMALLTAQSIFQAIDNTDAAPLLRISEISESQIKQALDAGAEGIVVPHVRTRQDAELIVRYAKYPPHGTRGLTAARAARYGLSFEGYAQDANDITMVIALVEDADALEAVADIARTDGIDAVFVGPWDLSASMGHLGQPGAPDVVSAVERIVTEVHAAGKKAMIYAEDGAQGKDLLERGYDAIVLGEDYLLLLEQARAELAIARG